MNVYMYYVCMYVYMYVCMYICITYVCMYVCMYVRTYILVSLYYDSDNNHYVPTQHDRFAFSMYAIYFL